MSYTVTWTDRAEQELAAIWLAAPDRQQVTQASAAIEKLLRATPDAVGEVRFDSVRILVEWPLGVEYEILDADRRVSVVAVWDVRTSAGLNGAAH